MFDLPEHLASLNTLVPSSSTAPVDPSIEEAVWEYFNTDALFQNFGVNPSEYDSKHDTASKLDLSPVNPQPVVASSSSSSALPADLKSFIQQFASEQPSQAFGSTDYANALALGLHMTTPAAVPSTAHMSDIMAAGSSSTSPDDSRPSGAKKLKSLGAGQAEIEEDKRRRNTEASARFRAKKKEREQALEVRAKELEGQVAQLTNDKLSLENENRLLKAIVLGSRGGGEGAQEALEQFLGKRKRQE
ncbi:hypothetical protein BD324DRAFT_653681 [Kockovaella imperatae]|uniref:BZIP domain-containing protein n=1 Tax=Kockovaella imperatae TaxID=4999 RepID=A0A1Y1UA80_9TREE|nr:hypothetical protein BD324DRAFT_653681 [Kockovaella imperatae]ORX33985.1 hypothetical protein BD324DRAFT_653681 [Kockovaella imperatae]